jgi:glycyl-tRNA synthetase beta chain
MSASLLIELLTEELPPKALRALGKAFSQTIASHLAKEGLCDKTATVTGYASPRRLAVHIGTVLEQAPSQNKKEKLLPTAIALDAQGQPTAPLIKKLAGLGLTLGENITLSQLERVHDGKQEQLYCQCATVGAHLESAAQAALHEAITKLPIPKVMSYQRADGSAVKFVRPAHGLMALHGERVLALNALGLQAGQTTLGHRFHSHDPIRIQHADHYADTLKSEGKVIASFDERRALIGDQLQAKAKPNTVIAPDSLLDEVTSLVEWPVVLEGAFEKEFLEVPQECLILTMQQNQKYFALTSSDGTLANRFLLVSNIESKDPRVVVSGNERVLRARLSDAKFFFDQDRKKSLASRLEGLANVVYHNKIGTQRERSDRIAKLAQQWAPLVGADAHQAHRAALLAKADLLTDMVGEFPELQGVIGTYYARHDQEAEEIALAIEAHYHPRFSGDSLPQNPTGLAVALADKMETLVGIWGIGLAPTGDKDPFALRRHALGVIRITVEKNLSVNLSRLIQEAAQTFQSISTVSPNTQEIHEFMLDRLRAWLKEKGASTESIEAVIAQCPDQIAQVPSRLAALDQFMQQPEAAALCSANKRISNILKKSESAQHAINANLLREPAEKTLSDILENLAPQAQRAVEQGQYGEALTLLSRLKVPVDAFFDSVMVNAEDNALKANRLALLAKLQQSMNQVADLSRMAA